jgi:two-component system chemotaxis response regulator CheY
MVAVPLRAISGVEVVEVGDGTRAWTRLRSESFDAAIIDWQMPGRNGLDLVKAARARDPDLPLIMVTAEADRQHVINAINAGVSDYLIKPFSPKMLWEKLNKLLQHATSTKS